MMTDRRMPELSGIGLAIEMPLKSYEGASYAGDTAKLGGRIADGPILQLQEVRQLGLVEFSDALFDVLGKNEFQKGLKLQIVLSGYERPTGVGAFLPGQR